MFLECWPETDLQCAALLSGPEASGKTHLANCWARRTGAFLLNPDRLGKETSETIWSGQRFGILENIENITDESALFHLLRYGEQGKSHLLMTSRLSARELPFATPDIRSRLLALPVAFISPPDNSLLRGFFTKSFADRQWRANGAVIDYLTLHTERTFPAAQEIIRKLELLVNTTKKELTIPAIKPLIERVG